MYVGSHFRIGSYIYKSVLTKYLESSITHKYLFSLSNVLPDLDYKLIKVGHYIESSLPEIHEQIKRMKDPSITKEQQLISLGIICHFLSDYFCMYHAIKRFKKRPILIHLFYELKLHILLNIYLLFPKRLHKMLCIGQGLTEYSDIETIIYDLQRDYLKEKNSLTRDIVYALKATSLVTIYLLETSTNVVESNEEEIDMLIATAV